MGGGGSIQGFNDSLKNNRKLLRKSSFFPKERSFLNPKREYYKAAGGVESLRNASKEELLEIRKTIRNKRKIENIIMIVLFVIVTILTIYLMRDFFKENENYISAEDKKALELKNKEFSFFITDGDNYLEKGQWHNAVFQYNKALELFPTNYDASYRVAYALSYWCRNEKLNCKLAADKVQELLAEYPNKQELIELEQILIFENE